MYFMTSSTQTVVSHVDSRVPCRIVSIKNRTPAEVMRVMKRMSAWLTLSQNHHELPPVLLRETLQAYGPLNIENLLERMKYVF